MPSGEGLTGDSRSPGRGERSPARELAIAWGHLAVLWSFGFAQPLLDVLGDTPQFFVARGNTRGDILLLAFALTLLPPTALILLELAALRAPRIRAVLHSVFVALLVAAIALQALDGLLPGGAVAIAGALALGAAGAVIYARRPAVRGFLTVLTPAPAVFLALFLLVSPVSELVLPQDEVSASDGGPGARTPVVMVVFDEFSGASLLDRRLRIDRSRYPNFAELARDSTWYRNATTVDYATERAVPAILTGTRASGDSLPIASDHPRNLFTLLGGRYTLRVRETATQLCPESLCGERARKATGDRLRSLVDDLSVVSLHLLLPEEMEDELPAVDATFESFRGQGGDGSPSSGALSGIPASAFEDRPGQFARFLGGIRGPGRPALDFLHVALPHWPWQYLPSGQQYPTDTTRIPGVRGPSWVADPFPAEQGYQRYLLQVAYVDRLVGMLVERLKDLGLWDRALVVVTADHGVSFRPGSPRRYATPRNLPDIASVPLFVKSPGQRIGRADDSPVETVDILPTIADALRLRPGWSFDGRSLLGPRVRRATVSVLSGEPVRMSLAAFERARAAEIRRRVALFGENDGGSGVFALGGGAGLLGRRPDRLRRAPPDGSRASVDDLPLLEHVNPRSRLLPALVRGSIEGPLRAGSSLAVAVNDTIRAVAPTYRDGGRLSFSALLPPAAFVRGRNRIGLFSVAGTVGAPALAPVALGGAQNVPSGRLRTEDGATRIELPGGRVLQVSPGAVSGFVEAVTTPDPGHVLIAGWAVDPRSKHPARRVLVFADGRLVAAGAPAVPRLDLATKLGRAAVLGGYRLQAIVAQADEVAGDPERLRVFAVVAGRATELEYLDSARRR